MRLKSEPEESANGGNRQLNEHLEIVSYSIGEKSHLCCNASIALHIINHGRFLQVARIVMSNRTDSNFPFGSAIAAIFTFGLSISPVLAEEIFYCNDTATAGFKWDKGEEAIPANFRLSRFTVKIDAETERRITETSEGDTSGYPQYYTCKRGYGNKTTCDDGNGTKPWVFYGSSYYVRTFLAGGPRSTNSDPNILIAYGTCTKF
jgi:hypothetical protein